VPCPTGRKEFVATCLGGCRHNQIACKVGDLGGLSPDRPRRADDHHPGVKRGTTGADQPVHPSRVDRYDPSRRTIRRMVGGSSPLLIGRVRYKK